MGESWVEAEFKTIFSEHYQRLIRVVRRVVPTDAEAEEVCAEVFLRLYRAGPGVASGGLVGGWLYRSATRAAIDTLRTNRRKGLKEELDAADSDLQRDAAEDASEGPLGRLLAGERIAEVRAVLARLKPDKAQILLLRHSGLSYLEIAAAMQINAGSVGTKLARAEAEFATLYKRRQPEQQQGLAKSTPPSLKTAKEEP